MVPTEALRCELAALGFGGLRVIARGIDTRRFDPARRSKALRASWGAGPEDPVLLHVGRLAAEKNLGVLAAAYEEARRRTPRAKLVLVGDGPQRRDFQARFPHAIFAGTRAGEDLAAHFASADLFVFPSLTETYGNVTIEAMASGLAVVAFDYAAAHELMRPGESGLLAACDDARSFVSLVATLAEDGHRMRELGARARAEAAMRGWDSVVQQLESVLYAAAAAAETGPTTSTRRPDRFVPRLGGARAR
jgi:glycosyltransferase involved in cell wall biosynthesis